MGQKNSSVLMEELSGEIRRIYRSDRAHATEWIERFLEERFKGYSREERRAILKKLILEFDGGSVIGDHDALPLDQKEFSRLFSLLLGETVSKADLASEEIMEKLAHSLNTVFDTLNQIIIGIHSTLLGRKVEIETIRHVIGSSLEGDEGSQTLQGYLDKIQEAFVVAHRAFQQAAHNEVKKILAELDPRRISARDEGKFSFGLLRKAEHFEQYKEKYQILKEWFESGRFQEDLLREFERLCNKQYKTKAGES